MMYWIIFPTIAAVSVWFAVRFCSVAYAFTAGMCVGVLCCFLIDELIEWMARRRK